MAIDYDRLMGWDFPPVRQSLTRQDCILYALGVGLGGDPLDPAQLRFVYEDRLAALPTMAVVLEVGARLKGHASFGTLALSARSLWRASEDLTAPVRAMTFTENRLSAGKRFKSSSDSPE